ncbi:MAG: cell surface protein SprA, partial [bacterium]|nr:cell surface protein SprA [bacterium]
SFGGGHKGLFGFKTESKLGNLRITTIASLEKGQKQSMTIKGGAKSQPQTIHDYEYLKDTYYYVDDIYYKNFRLGDDGLPKFIGDNVIKQFELWRSGTNYDKNPESIKGWAVVDPNNIAEADTADGGNAGHVSRYFLRVDKTEYTIDLNTGYIVLNQPAQNEVLAVAYTTEGGLSIGTIFPPGVIPDSTSRLELKLIRTDNPNENDPSWDLEWKNVYSLGSRNIDKEGFELQIVNSRDNPKNPIDAVSKLSYLEIFGLDRYGEGGGKTPDGKFDVDVPWLLNMVSGHLILPGKRPFAPKSDNEVEDSDKVFGQTSRLVGKTEQIVPQIYDNLFVDVSKYTAETKYDIEVIMANRDQTYNLGFQVIQDSEEIFLDGNQLERGTDYTIDYQMGTLTVVNSAALGPGSTMEVKYESAEVFQLDKKTLFGTRFEYPFGNNSFLGGTALFLSERILENRVTVGNEPIKNMVWGLNGKFGFSSGMVTKALNVIPLLNAKGESRFDIEGEFAQSLPNPNTMSNSLGEQGVAYLDDFEGTKRINYIGVYRKSWKKGSAPVLEIPFSTDTLNNSYSLPEDQRAKLIWYNPVEAERPKITDIFPNRQVSERTGSNRANILTLQLIKDSHKEFNPDSAWGSIMKWMTQGSFNQTDSKFLEIWIKGNSGTIGIDLGLMSEDAYRPDLRQLDTEDQGVPNNILNDGEDTGLDGIAAADGTDNGELEDDDWYYTEGSTSYDNINGTEENGSGDKIDDIRKPDSEDLDADGNLDLRNDYFQYIVDLSDITSPLIAGGNPDGWKLYRIPLTEFTSKIGNPSLSQIEYSRIWLKGVAASSEGNNRSEKISIYSIDLVGNSWKELGTYFETAGDTLNMNKGPQYSLTDSTIFVEVVNTEENQYATEFVPAYTSPPGVAGLYDKINKITSKEQSLQIRYQDLKPKNSAAIKKTFIKVQNVVNYGKLKLFVKDPNLTWGQESDYEIYFQFGRDDNNYYEVRKRIKADENMDGWDAIEIDLKELPITKTTLYNSTRTLEDSTRWFVKNKPTLTNLLSFTIGIKNTGDANISGLVWIDELRVTDVDRIPAKAVRLNVTMNLADLGNLSVGYSKRDADFISLTEKFGQGGNSGDLSVNFGTTLDRFLPYKGYRLPFSFVQNTSAATPKYRQGTDILYESAVDSSGSALEEITSKSRSMTLAISKSGASKWWIIRKFIDPINISVSHTNTDVKDLTNEVNNRWANNASIRYQTTIPKLSVAPFKYLPDYKIIRPITNFDLTLLPQNFNTNMTFQESSSKLKLLGANDTKEAYTFGATRTLTTTYNPLETLNLSITRASQHNLSDYKDKTKIFTALLDPNTVISSTQNLTGQYTPKFIPFVAPSISYSANYGLQSSKQAEAQGKSATMEKSIGVGFSFNLKDMVNKFYRYETPVEEQAPAPRPVIRPGGIAVQQPKPEEQEPEEENKPGRSINPLYYLERFADKFSSISASVSNNTRLANLGLDGTPGLAYQFGFAADPGVPVKEDLGGNTESETNGQTMNFSTRMALTDNAAVTIRYTSGTTESNQNGVASGNSNGTMFIMGDTKIPMADYSLSISKLEELFFLDKVTNSVTLQHTYAGVKQENWQDTPDNKTTTSYTWGFSPLVGLNIAWKKGISSNITMVKQNQLSLDRTGVETKTVTSNITASTTFQWATGFRIPLPFLRSRRISNSVSYNMTFASNNSQTLKKTATAEEFTAYQSNKQWNVRQTVSYSFTQKVNGGFYFDYRKGDNIQRGGNSDMDFGLNVRIRIDG